MKILLPTILILGVSTVSGCGDSSDVVTEQTSNGTEATEVHGEHDGHDHTKEEHHDEAGGEDHSGHDH